MFVFQGCTYWLLLVFIPMCCHVLSFLFKNLYMKTFVRTFFNLLIKSVEKTVEDNTSKYFIKT